MNQQTSMFRRSASTLIAKSSCHALPSTFSFCWMRKNRSCRWTPRHVNTSSCAISIDLACLSVGLQQHQQTMCARSNTFISTKIYYTVLNDCFLVRTYLSLQPLISALCSTASIDLNLFSSRGNSEPHFRASLVTYFLPTSNSSWPYSMLTANLSTSHSFTVNDYGI